MSSEHSLFIYHTNDIHSYFEHWPKIDQFIKKRRNLHFRKNENMLYFDIGDHADRCHPMTDATDGQGNVKLLNEIGVQATTIGNNEGLTFSKETLNQLYKDATFPVLVANLLDEDGEVPFWAKSYHYIQLDNSLKIGLIGVTAPFLPFYDKLGWTIQDPFEILPHLVAKVRAECDIVILLSHLGFPADEEIAEHIEGIDIILGAHTHHVLQSGKNVKGTLIGQAGKFGYHVGQIKLTIQSETKEIVEFEMAAIETKTMPPSPQTTNLLERLQVEQEEIMSEEVVTLYSDLSVDWFKPSTGPIILAEALKEWCKTNISMVNAGVLLESIPAGRVTRGDIHRICPHPINPAVVKLRGDRLKETILHSFTERMQRLELKGFGFRGEVLGRMAFSGIDVQTKKLGDNVEHVVGIYIDGNPIDPKKEYELATLDMFTFGKLYPAIAESTSKVFYMPELLRDVLLWKLKQNR
ncbi:bifunctional metallophosphatase/5'-nucleotidase [Alkalihalobacterium alkalinitrilicum]|uniref:bifunctional metallophosphatase/5'-nucleotidase n=1 Tax=Alkalihalobacterium alkalinitrilicum TaxID=427920 RepID=UPI0009954DE1|nr:bifunctional UDP-sugar hydrolase/5'-nucleotidase [Alkalihalobacterium alkalinitrilicum]